MRVFSIKLAPRSTTPTQRRRAEPGIGGQEAQAGRIAVGRLPGLAGRQREAPFAERRDIGMIGDTPHQSSRAIGEKPMQPIHAVYENGIFRPIDPVQLPDRCEVEITVRSQSAGIAQNTLVRLAEIGRQFPANPDLPTDLAAQHDHYLYGLPKRP